MKIDFCGTEEEVKQFKNMTLARGPTELDKANANKLWNRKRKMTNKPDVIKAALSVGITDFDRARIGYDKMNVYERKIWNEAIEAVMAVLIEKTFIANELKILIRGLKK